MWVSTQGEHHGDDLVRQLAANFPNLESATGVSFLSAEGMKALTALRNLKCLHIGLKRRQGYYGPTGLSHLAGLGSLEELHIVSQESLSDADLACLEALGRLRDLLILGQDMTDQGMASIGKLKQLEELHLSCSVTRSSLNQLNGLSNLQYLKVSARPRRNAAKTNSADELTLDLSGLKQMKNMNLSGLPLHDDDLEFLKHLPLLDDLMIQPVSRLTGASLSHLREMPALNRLWISGLSDCTGEDLAHLNDLAKLRRLTLSGDVNDKALASLTGPLCLESLNVDTDEPIRKQTVTDLTERYPVIEYIRINELPKFPTRPPQQEQRERAPRPGANRRTPSRRRQR